MTEQVKALDQSYDLSPVPMTTHVRKQNYLQQVVLWPNSCTLTHNSSMGTQSKKNKQKSSAILNE